MNHYFKGGSWFELRINCQNSCQINYYAPRKYHNFVGFRLIKKLKQ